VVAAVRMLQSLALFLLGAAVCDAAVLFASPNGAASGTCASAASSCTLSFASAMASSGDTVMLSAGSFFLASTITITSTTNLAFVGAGPSTQIHRSDGVAFAINGAVVVTFSALSCSDNSDCTCISATGGAALKVRASLLSTGRSRASHRLPTARFPTTSTTATRCR
jgi:hypothetical protein